MKRKLILWIIVVFTVTIAAYAGVKTVNDAKIETVSVVCPETKQLTSSIHTRGTLRGAESSAVGAATSGRVVEVGVKKGDAVKKGQFLFSVYDGRENASYYAPFDGVVGIVTIEEGSPAIPGISFVYMTSRDHMIVSCEVEESCLSSLAIGQAVNLTLDAYPERSYHGTVSQILPYATVSGGAAAILMEQGTTTVEVNITIRESTADLIPGLSVDSDIVTELYPSALMIPCSAIMNEDGVDYVFLYEDGSAHKQAIEKGLYYNGAYQVLAGVDGASLIIESPSDTLKDGDRVRIS